tara:strand:+ start:283 stop:567 length:285 start_codon:yes stop_codon:yes gene_type:complete
MNNYGKWHNKVITYESSCDDSQVAVHYTSVGCYPLMYLMSGHTCMCPDCALINEDEHQEIVAFAHYEGQLTCEECDTTVDGAYYEEDESESDSD